MNTIFNDSYSSFRYCDPTLYANQTDITDIVNGTEYQIYTVGTSDFTLIGAADNNIGTIFTASGAGVGDGVAFDLNYGLYKRIDDINTEAWYTLNNPTVPNTAYTTAEFVQDIGKYRHYYNMQNTGSITGNLRRYHYWNTPLIKAYTRLQTEYPISAIAIFQADESAGQDVFMGIKIDRANKSYRSSAALANGDRIYFRDDMKHNLGLWSNWYYAYLFNNDIYVGDKKIDGDFDKFHLYTDAALTTKVKYFNMPERHYFDDDYNYRFYAQWDSTDSEFDLMMATDVGLSVTDTDLNPAPDNYTKLYINGEGTLGTSAVVGDITLPTGQSWVTGTIVDTLSSKRYFECIIRNNVATDPTNTHILGATQSESYYSSHSENFTGPGSHNFGSIDVSGLTTAEKDKLAEDIDGWCRITATINSGTLSVGSMSAKLIQTASADKQKEIFYYRYIPSSETIKIYDNRATGRPNPSETNSTSTGDNIQDFILGGTTPDVDFNIEFIKPTKLGTPLSGNTTTWADSVIGIGGISIDTDGWNGSAESPKQNTLQIPDIGVVGGADPQASVSAFVSGGYDHYEIDNIKVNWPGNKKYTYKDTNNVKQVGTKDLTNHWHVLSTSYDSTGAGEFQTGFDLSLDSNGYIDKLVYTESDLASTFRGQYYFYSTVDEVLLHFDPIDDQYVAPTVGTAEAEDAIFTDNDDHWTETGENGDKLWPNHIHPKSANISIEQPSSITNAQNGAKYVRTSGIIKHTIEVDYPPMLEDDFRIFEATIEAVRGQTTPFYLRLQDGANNLFLTNEQNSSVVNPWIRNSYNVPNGTSLIEFDGFTGEESGVIKKGSHVIVQGVNGNNNGRLCTVINEASVNKYGEGVLRLSYPVAGTFGPTNKIFTEPNHVVVTLADNAFNYTIDTAGFYRISVKFMLDDWK